MGSTHLTAPTTGHGPQATGNRPPATGTRCPECGQVCEDFGALQVHCADRPECDRRVCRLLHATDLGYRECPRCEAMILGVPAMVTGADGSTVWVHRACLTADEAQDLGIADDVHEAMEYARRLAGALPRPCKPQEVLP